MPKKQVVLLILMVCLPLAALAWLGEAEGNVFLYRRKGYAVLGETDVDEIHSWSMFRIDDEQSAGP